MFTQSFIQVWKNIYDLAPSKPYVHSYLTLLNVQHGYIFHSATMLQCTHYSKTTVLMHIIYCHITFRDPKLNIATFTAISISLQGCHSVIINSISQELQKWNNLYWHVHTKFGRHRQHATALSYAFLSLRNAKKYAKKAICNALTLTDSSYETWNSHCCEYYNLWNVRPVGGSLE
jgi:hypothetical protein